MQVPLDGGTSNDDKQKNTNARDPASPNSDPASRGQSGETNGRRKALERARVEAAARVAANRGSEVREGAGRENVRKAGEADKEAFDSHMSNTFTPATSSMNAGKTNVPKNIQRETDVSSNIEGREATTQAHKNKPEGKKSSKWNNRRQTRTVEQEGEFL
jgi:hypothetical protein